MNGMQLLKGQYLLTMVATSDAFEGAFEEAFEGAFEDAFERAFGRILRWHQMHFDTVQ